MAKRMLRWVLICVLAMVVPVPPAGAQHGAKNGEWRFYGGDAGTTKYSPLDQINAGNVKDLKIVWQWKSQNFGRRPDFNWEVTPLMVGGVLYFTAGTRRAHLMCCDRTVRGTPWLPTKVELRPRPWGSPVLGCSRHHWAE